MSTDIAKPDLSDLEREVMAWLHVHARGRAAPATQETLAAEFFGTDWLIMDRRERHTALREISEACEGLRRKGRPIGSSSSGMFVIVDRRDAAVARPWPTGN